MFKNYSLIKTFVNSGIVKKRIVLRKILIENKKKDFPLYSYNMDFFFEDLKRSKKINKIPYKQILFSDYLKKFLYCIISLIVSKKDKKKKYFLYYSISNEIIQNKYTNIFKENLFNKIKKKEFLIKHLIKNVPKNFWDFTYERPVNFDYLYLNIISKIKYFFLSNRYKSQKTKKIILNTINSYEQYKYWKRFLRNEKPKLIFLIDKMNNFPLLQAANELKMPSYELQHGSPLVNKDNNLYKIKIKGKFCNNQSWFSRFKPDHYLCCGEFWKKNIEINSYSKKITNIGLNINHINSHKKKNVGILLLSELAEFDQIEKILNQFDKLKIKKNLVKIRFHPVISLLPSRIKLFLKKNDINYSMGKNTNLNKDLINIDKVIGLNSTLLFQLFERGYKTYFFDKKFFKNKYLIKDKNFLNLTYLDKKHKNQFFCSNKNKIPI